MLALERHPERKDLTDILERFVKDDIARQQPDGYVGHCNPRYADYGRHELYGQGYFIEAAIRHMEFTKGRDRRYFDAAYLSAVPAARARTGKHDDSCNNCCISFKHDISSFLGHQLSSNIPV